jgi:ubiquitin-large subunit ribosomal protein L40e
MQLFVNFGGKIITIDVEPDDDIDAIKEKINDKEGIARDYQRIIYAGKQLESGKSLREYGIGKEYTVYLAVTQSGYASRYTGLSRQNTPSKPRGGGRRRHSHRRAHRGRSTRNRRRRTVRR